MTLFHAMRRALGGMLVPLASTEPATSITDSWVAQKLMLARQALPGASAESLLIRVAADILAERIRQTCTNGCVVQLYHPDGRRELHTTFTQETLERWVSMSRSAFKVDAPAPQLVIYL